LPEIRNWKWNHNESRNGKPLADNKRTPKLKPVKGAQYAHST
jgi:hypothetical protein